MKPQCVRLLFLVVSVGRVGNLSDSIIVNEIVNEVETFADGTCTGALPGKLLRSTDIAA